MKLNPDCIRDLLITVEELQTIDSSGRLSTLTMANVLGSTLTDKYEDSDIVYSLKQCIDNWLLDGTEHKYLGGTDYRIKDITPSGHEFLSNIRLDTNWNKVKKKASDVGSFSLEVLKEIAVDVITKSITGQV